MAEMTVLHIASPFAFSTPVNESRSSNSASDEQGGGQQGDEQAKVDSAGSRTGSVRDDNVLDARDARVSLMRSVDLTTSPANLDPVTTSVDAVLAAYQQDMSASDRDDAE